MGHALCLARLALQRHERFRVGLEFLAQHLDRDIRLAVSGLDFKPVRGSVDHSHAADTDYLFQCEAAFEYLELLDLGDIGMRAGTGLPRRPHTGLPGRCLVRLRSAVPLGRLFDARGIAVRRLVRRHK